MVDLSDSRARTWGPRRDDPDDGLPRVSIDPPPRRRGLHSRGYTTGLVLIDYLVAWASFALGLVLLSTVSRTRQNHLANFNNNLQHGFWLPIGIVLGFALTGAYRQSRRSATSSTFSEMKDYAMSASFGGFIALSASYVVHHFGAWAIQVPTQVIVAVLIATLLIAFSHAVLRHLVLRRNPQRIAVVDDGRNYGRIATHLHLQHGVVLVGRIDTAGTATDDSLGSIEQIDAIVAINKLDRIVFGTIEVSSPAIEHAYRRATEIVDTALVPSMYEVISWRSRLTELSGLPLLELAPRNFSGYDRALKRVFDLGVASVALVLTAPLSICVALAVKLTSRGPVLFRQERLGRDRRPFTILKFRTMRVEDGEAAPAPVATTPAASGERAPLFVARNKTQHAARLTPIGGFLRRSGIDEIPQFLNVLTGSMSIVGPRPFITAESEQHSKWSARRFEVRPGLTGLWQVSGRNNLTEDELRQLDYLYVNAWSMWWDVKICFDTPRAMVRGLGAY
jgi:exopolysaccharide biosynthesis polyprenyl glycosylphosphotransferase